VRSVGAGAGLFREVVVTPSAGFDRLEEVLVVRDPPEQARAHRGRFRMKALWTAAAILPP
jgi:cell shape-determining protein MreC